MRSFARPATTAAKSSGSLAFNSWSPTGEPVAPSPTSVGRNPEREPSAKAGARVEESRTSSADPLAFCQENLARHKYPRQFHIRPAPPNGPTGRILNSALIEKLGSKMAQEFWTSGFPLADCGSALS